ncbi:MAG: response regulator [Rhodoferax sp.]|nr:response regulator [Rhodoferax sp.]
MSGLSVAQVGHELRTPLNAITGFARLIQTRPGHDQVLANAQHIAAAARVMLRVVDDLVDHARLAAGRLEIDGAGLVRPALLLSSLGHTAPMLLGSDQVHVKLRLDTACPVALCGDPQRLAQILLNLTANAARHTLLGEIVLECRVLDRASDAARLRFIVADTGTGIPADMNAQLGRPFVQASAAVGGSGLGLSVVRQLLELLGSSLNLVSVHGGGTLAWFDLDMPVHPPPVDAGAPAVAIFATDRRWSDTLAVHLFARGHHVTPDPRQASTWWIEPGHARERALVRLARLQRRAAHVAGHLAFKSSALAVPPGGADVTTLPATPLSGLSLLVVDDSALNRTLMQQLLNAAGARVTVAGDGALALTCARAEAFDAAVLDVQLPDGDGRALASQLHALDGCGDLPVVFVSAFIGQEFVVPVGDPRVIGYLPKPFDPDRLVGLLARKSPARTSAPAADDPAPARRASTAMRALYVQEWPRLALAVRRARSTRTLGAAVHALRGNLAWMGDREALSLAAEVEAGLHAGKSRRDLPVRALLKRARQLAGQ